jgi:nucleoside-diphosphate-sugar epimerase
VSAAAGRPAIAVLGASGFVGSAVAAALARRPGRLRLVARRPAAVPAGAVADVEVVCADLTEGGQVASAVAGASLVVHLVTQVSGWRATTAGDEPVNVGTLREVLAASARRPGAQPPVTVLFAGAASQAGVPRALPLDGTEPDQPVTVYDQQKLAAERLLLAAHAQGAVTGISLRLPTVYGDSPDGTFRDKGVLAGMTRRALRGEVLTTWDGGAVERDFVHVDDIAAAFAAAARCPAALGGRRWLLGSGHGTPMSEALALIAATVSEHTGRPAAPLADVPAPPDAAESDLSSVRIDASAFGRATGWSPQIPLATGLRRMVTALSGQYSAASNGGLR